MAGFPAPPALFSPAVSGTWPGVRCSVPGDRAESTGQGSGTHVTPSVPGPLRHGAHLGPVLGQEGPDGLDLIVEDVVLLHLVVHQRQVRPEALAAQLVLGGAGGEGRVGQGGGLAARPVRLGSAPPRAGRGVSRVAPSGIQGEAVTFIYTRPLM